MRLVWSGGRGRGGKGVWMFDGERLYAGVLKV